MKALSTNIAEAVERPLHDGPWVLHEILEYLHFFGASRYTPRSGLTFCNIFTGDAARLFGKPIPAMLANDLFAYLKDQSKLSRSQYREVSEKEAQGAADRGELVLAVWRNENGHGHVTPLTLSLGEGGTWVSHVGRSLRLRCRLEEAFGANVPSFFVVT